MTSTAFGKIILVISVAWAVISGNSSASTNYTWTGGGADGSWDTPANWGTPSYPCASGDTALFNDSTPQQPVINGNFSIGSLSVTGSTNWTWSGSGALTVGSFFNYGCSGTGVFNAVVTGSGGLVVNGGSLTLGGANTYGGATTVSNGLLMLGIDNALPTNTSLGIANTTGARFDINDHDQTMTSIAPGGAAGGTITNSGIALHTITITNQTGGANYINNNIRGGANLAMVMNGGSLVVNASLTGFSGGFTLNGGNFTWNGNPGATYIGNGILYLGNATITPTAGNAYSIPNAIQLFGNPTVASGDNRTALTGGMTMTGNRTISVVSGQSLMIGNNKSGNPSGLGIGESGGTRALTKDGGGTLAVVANSTYGGQAVVAGGTLTVSSTDGAGTNAGGVIVGSASSSNNATFALDNNANGGADVTFNRPVTIVTNNGYATSLANTRVEALTYGNNYYWGGAITFNQNLTISANDCNSSANGLNWFTNTWTGFGNSLTITGTAPSYGAVIYKNGTNTPSFAGGTYLRSTTLRYNYNQPGAGTAADVQWAYGNYDGSYSGIGAITIQGGNFEFYGSAASGSDNARVNFLNDFTVTSAGGGLYGYQTSSAVNNYLTGKIALGGPLTIGTRTSTGEGGSTMHQTGQIAIDNTTIGLRSIRYTQAGSIALSLDGNIVDGPGWARNNFLLTGSSGTFNITGAGNSYNCDTIVALSGGSSINVAAGSSLGIGNVTVLGDGKLILNSAGNIAAGKTVKLAGNIAGMGTVVVKDNFVPTISQDSRGTIAIDSSLFDSITNLAALGNGGLYIGSVSGGTLTNSILSPGADNTYRLGSGGGTLTVNNGVLTGSAALVVGLPSCMSSGTVILGSANSYSGGTTIYGNNSLQGVAQLSGSPFGSSSGAFTLCGGYLQLNAIDADTSTTIGDMTLKGLGRVSIDSGSYPSRTTTLNINSLSLNSVNRDTNSPPYSRDCLLVYGVRGLLGDKEQIKVAGGMPAMTNGILPGYFVVSANDSTIAGDHATYDGTYGFGTFNSYTTAVSDWNNITTDGNQVVANTSASTIPGGIDKKIYGLMLTRKISVGAPTPTLTIGTGGIVFKDNTDQGATDGHRISANVAFKDADGNDVEGLIYVSDSSSVAWAYDRCSQIGGNITAGKGLTISGKGIFSRLSAAAATQLDGIANPITINQATLGLNDGGNAVFSVTNDFVLKNGGKISFQAKCNPTFSGTLTLREGGGAFYLVSYQRSETWTQNGKITGPGPLTINSDSTRFVIINAANDHTGGTIIKGSNSSYPTTVTVTNNSSLGTGDVILNPYSALYLLGDSNIASTSRLTINVGGTAYFQSLAPAIGLLEGGGNIVLGKSGVNTVLTVGDTNSSVFYGVISQSGAVGGLCKTGSGTLTLCGNNTYTGATSVTNGTLIVNGSINGDVNVATNAAFGGTVRITGNLNAAGATLRMTINGTNHYDQVAVTGLVSIADCRLVTTLGYIPSLADKIYLVLNDGIEGVSGTFLDAPEGDIVQVGTFNRKLYKAFITYVGNGDNSGADNDIMLYNFYRESGTILFVR